MKIREKRYIWLPLLLLIYGAVMALYFGPEIIAAGKGWQVAVTMGVDVTVCILLFFFLRKKQRLAASRPK